MIAPRLRRLLCPALAALVCAWAQTSHAAGRVTGFEPGDPAVSSTGDAGTLTGSFQGEAPPEGTHQFILTNIQSTDTAPDNAPVTGTSAVSNATLQTFFGVSLTGVEGSGVLIPFTVSAGDLFLSFQYDFLTNETAQSTPRNDFAFYTLNGTATTFSSVTSEAGNFSSFDGGSPFIEHTGYKTFEISVSSLAPGNYSLGIGIEDATNGNIASGVLIDNVQVTIPEPSTAALAVSGVCLLLALRRRNGGMKL